MPPVKPAQASLTTRALKWILARRRGEVRALRDLEALRGTIRLTALFAITVIGPAILLSYFALASLRSEELAVEADVTRRADQVAAQVIQDLESSMAWFEQATVQRLINGQPTTAGFADLSPFLLVVFRVDGSGQLAAPFAPPDQLTVPAPSPYYEELVGSAGAAERSGQYADAAALYHRAEGAADHPSHAGSAAFAAARAQWRAGQVREAEIALADVLSDYGPVRDARGFRIGDLATLTLAAIAQARQPELGGVVLRDIVERMLDDRWEIGRPGEAAIARRALGMMEAGIDPDWVANATTRLSERSRQLFWAERLADELELIVNASDDDRQGFRYYPRPESHTLWATLWWEGELYAFAFAYDEVVTALREASAAASALDEDVVARLAGPGSTAGALATRPLAPWLGLTVMVSAKDPVAIALRKEQARRLRLVVIFVAVGMTVFGVVFSSLLVGQELESARMKADFAANVSHELRSPITQIRLKAEALQLDLVTDAADAQAHYDAIVREAERLSRLVDNVLDFAAIERGAKRYTFRPEDVAEVVWASVEATRDALREAGLDVEVDLADNLPVAWLDREAVGQVLTNLLSNAIKYGSDGGWIGVRAREGLDGIDVSIADRGQGMTAEDQARVFDRFYRSSDPAVRRRRGTGIGLTIVRYIVEAHRGTISVESEPGQGTTFTVTFPLTPPKAK